MNSGIKRQSGNRKNSKSSETPGYIIIVLLWIILSFVITYFWTIIGILGGIIAAVVAYMFFRKSRSVENKSLATESEEFEVDEEVEELKQYVRIVLESQNIVNESANIDVVVSRLDLVVENMKKISSYNNVNLYFVGMTREYVLEKLDYILANYDVMIEQGLARAYLREIDRIRTLKTERGKYSHMIRFFDDLSANKKLNENHYKYLLKLKFTYIIKSAIK